MKKFVIYILCVLIVAFSAVYIYQKVQSGRYDETAIPYIKEVLPLISTWDAAQAGSYMAPEVLNQVDPQDLQLLMSKLSVLGELVEIVSVRFKNVNTGEYVAGGHPLVTYKLDTRYSSGDVEVRISLVDRGGSYEVYRFNFGSEILAQP